MTGTVKITPSAFQIITLHCSIDSSQEMRGVLIGKIIFPDVFVVTAIPLSKSKKHDINAINRKCEGISRVLGTTYGQVGWYHSHSEVGPNPTEEDVHLHLKFQMEFPNSIALILQGCKKTDGFPGKMISFAAFRCTPDGTVAPISCQVRPLLPTADASKFNQASSIALNDVLEVVKEYIDEHDDQSEYIDKSLLQPLILTLRSMHSASHQD